MKNRLIKNQRVLPPALKKALFAIGVVVFLIALWWILAVTAFKNKPILPTPIEAVAALFSTGRVFISVFNTVGKALIGFVISFFLGLGFALLANRFQNVKLIVDPLVTLIRAFPTLAVTFLLLMYLGTSETAVIVGSFMIFPVFYTGLYTAINDIDPKLREVAKVYKVPKINTFTGLTVPEISSHLFASLLSAFSLNLKVVIAAEIAGGVARDTIGNFMAASRAAGDYAAMFGWVIAAIVTAFIFEGLIKLIMRLCMPWKYAKPPSAVSLYGKGEAAGSIDDGGSGLMPAGFLPPTKTLYFENVNFSYGPQKEVLVDFSERFDAGKVHAIMGASGAGKTTVLNLAAGLIKPSGGFAGFKEDNGGNGAEVRVSYMFQEPRLIKQRTVLKNLIFTLYPVYKTKQKKRKEVMASVKEIAKKYLSFVGLEGSENLYPHQLSGGMAQRVSLARAFSFPSSVLLMDEPFKGLDDKLKNQILELFLRLQAAEPRTVLFVTHEKSEADRVAADKIIHL